MRPVEKDERTRARDVSAGPHAVVLAVVLGLAGTACTTWESNIFDDDTVADDDATGDDDTGDDDTGDDDTGDDDTGDDDTGDDDTGSNQPPGAPTIAIDPPDPEPEDDLLCAILQDSVDPENDPVSYTWQWAVDGTVIGFSGPNLTAGATEDGQFWSCTVVPSDPQQDGEPAMASVAIGDVQPNGYTLAVEVVASGGPSGGSASVVYDHVMLDANFDPQCSVLFEFDSDYGYGTGQGADYYQHIDEVVTFASGGEVGSSCPITWTVYDSDPIAEWMWERHPLTFVSCDQVGSVPSLAATFLGEDDAGNLPTTDGTFGDFCDNVGPAVENTLGTGPVEGIWLMSGSSGMLDSLGTWSYFAPADTSNVEVYAVSGMIMQDVSNTDEPVPGLQGEYVVIPFWLYVYNY